MNKNSKINKDGSQGGNQRLLGLTRAERSLISRLRTNTVEFAQTFRGMVQDFNSGATTAQSFAFLLNYPGYYTNPAGTLAAVTTSAPLLADETKVFDEYKVVKLELNYLSWVTGQVRVNTSVAFTGPNNPTLITAVDSDDAAVWSSDAQSLNAQGRSIHNRYSTRVLTIKQTQTDPVDAAKWNNFQARVPSFSAAPDPNNPVKMASIKVRNFGYQLATTTEGTFYLEWTIIFRGSYALA